MAGERVVGDLRIGIDATLCVAFGDCAKVAPEAFRVDDDAGVVEFVDPAAVERQRLIEACAACPVDALLVWDMGGRQLVPSVSPLPLSPRETSPPVPLSADAERGDAGRARR